MNIDYQQLEFIHPKLRRILIWLEAQTGFELTITSLYRINDPGVHGTLPLRGVDLRMRSEELGKKVAQLINDSWVYDPKRTQLNCALAHGLGSNYHLHLQVCHSTEPRTFIVDGDR